MEQTKFRFGGKSDDGMFLDDDDLGMAGQDVDMDMESREDGGSDGGARPYHNGEEDGHGDVPEGDDREDNGDNNGDNGNDNGDDNGNDNGNDNGDDNGNAPEDDEVKESAAKNEELLAVKNDELDKVIGLKALPHWLQKAVNYLRAYKGHIGYLDAIIGFVNFERHVKNYHGKVSNCND